MRRVNVVYPDAEEDEVHKSRSSSIKVLRSLAVGDWPRNVGLFIYDLPIRASGGP